jgi:hypothetical protein
VTSGAAATLCSSLRNFEGKSRQFRLRQLYCRCRERGVKNSSMRITLASWLTLRDAVAVDTLARLATSRMAAYPRLQREYSQRKYTLCEVSPLGDWATKGGGKALAMVGIAW